MTGMRNGLYLAMACILFSCSEKDKTEYQNGYPNKLADNWIAFEFRGGRVENNDYIADPYDLVTALDPNRQGFLIIDRLYDSPIRVRAEISDTAFSVTMGNQLELIDTIAAYGTKYITLEGYVTENPVLTNFAYEVAGAFFENMAFYPTDIKDVIFIRAGFYDIYKTMIDTVLIIGYRKTGFEHVDY